MKVTYAAEAVSFVVTDDAGYQIFALTAESYVVTVDANRVATAISEIVQQLVAAVPQS